MADISNAQAESAQPRARGAVKMSTKPGHGSTVLAGLRQSGSLKALFPRTSKKALQTVLVNTSGGVTGGDTVSVEVSTAPGTHLTITTQAAERAYRAQAGETGRISNTLNVHENARLDWLPQETILFNGCSVQRSLRVELAINAQFLMVEPVIFGRAAMGEALSHIHFRDHIEIRRNAAPLYLDSMRLTGDVVKHLARSTTGGGCGAMTSLIYIAPDAEAHLHHLRDLLPTTGGASLIGADVIALRLLARCGFELRQSLIPILNHLTNNTLPRSWTT